MVLPVSVSLETFRVGTFVVEPNCSVNRTRTCGEGSGESSMMFHDSGCSLQNLRVQNQNLWTLVLVGDEHVLPSGTRVEGWSLVLFWRQNVDLRVRKLFSALCWSCLILWDVVVSAEPAAKHHGNSDASVPRQRSFPVQLRPGSIQETRSHRG